jgi:hypothetical protein
MAMLHSNIYYGDKIGWRMPTEGMVNQRDSVNVLRTLRAYIAVRIVPRGVVYESMILARSTRDQLTTADNRTG